MEDSAVRGRRREGGEHSRRREDGQPGRSLEEISKTVWLTPENAAFVGRGGLLHMTLEGKETRVILCREFPFDCPWEYISVLDDEHRELGIIRRTADFGDEARRLLEDELRRRYYAPEILHILSVKERYGFSYWRVTTAEGEVRFTLHDTYRSIQRVESARIVFSDVNGNRFEIPDLERLDARSRRRLELYL